MAKNIIIKTSEKQLDNQEVSFDVGTHGIKQCRTIIYRLKNTVILVYRGIS